MGDTIGNLADNILNNWSKQIFASISNYLMSSFQTVIGWINNIGNDFWFDPFISTILNLSTIICTIVLVISIVFLIGSMAEQIQSVDLKTVFLSFIKGFVFALSARWIGVSIMLISSEFVSSFKMTITSEEITTYVSALNNGTILALLIMSICVALFFFMCLSRTASLFVNILAAFAYIPYIVRGDTQKLGEWLSLTVSIALSYALQYISFYLSMMYLLQSKFVMGAILMIATFSTEKVLQHFGF
ncbi:MAG: hypothetical protein RR654_10945, partial [Oscillospiraceae bacterium]